MNSRILLIGFLTLLRKEILRIFRIWPQTILPSIITMSLYFVIFGQFIGQRIGEMDGIHYIQYIAPGLIMMAVITNSYGNVVTSFFSARFQKSIEEILVSPLPEWIILSGYVAGGIMRGIIIGATVTLIALLFTHLHVHNIALTIAIVISSAALFSLAGLTNAIFANKFDDVSIIPTFVLTPLTYLGGVFYSIDLLPPVWRHISFFNPILYMVNTFRYGILGVSDIGVYWAFILVILFVLVLFILNLYLLKRGVGIRA